MNSAVAIAHDNIFQALALGQAFDQLEPHQSAQVEFLCRWALMIQAATRRSPKFPDFSGLDHYLAHGLDATGGAITSKFASFVAEEKRKDALILKQNRLWQEEQETLAKKGQGSGSDSSAMQWLRGPAAAEAKGKAKSKAAASGEGTL